MLIFIDESGIHKTADHSAVALVYLEVKEYPAFEQAVLAVEKELRLTAFHWAETAWPVKAKFLDAILKLDFLVKVAVLRNARALRKDLETVLLHMIVEPRIYRIYIDGKKSRRYERMLKKVLRDHGVSARKLRTVNDQQSAGIRVADMVAGLVRTVSDGKRLERMMPYYRRLKKKIIVSLEL